MPSRAIAVCLLLLATQRACATPPAQAGQPQARATASDQPIRSHAALQAYLRTHAGKPTPLDPLPPLARQRFLDSLVFGTGGLGGFDTGDLATELSTGETKRILALFGMEAYAAMVKPRHPESPPPWRLAQAAPGPIQSGYDTLYRAQRDRQSDPAALHRQFDALFTHDFDAPGRLAALPARDLVYLLRALDLVAFETPADTDIERMRRLVAAMEQRGLASTDDLAGVQRGLLKTRRFDEARAYTAAHPGLPQLPVFEDATGDASGPSLWRASGDGDVLVRSAFDPAPLQIVVTAGCHFSQDAAAAISADPVLGPVFARHAHWLMLPPGFEEQDAILAWNRRFPGAQATQIHDRAEWTFLPPGWSMPSFLILRDGKVIERVDGWPSEPTEARVPLLRALERTGLLPAAQSPP